jgi:four helix bundle protein
VAAKLSQTPIAVVKAYDLVLWLLPKAEKFARSYRFTVGDRMVNLALDLLLLLVEAAYSTEKADLLDAANRSANGVRYLLRLAKDLKLLTLDSYGFAAERLDEIGRMIGGWQKSVRSRG